MLFNLPFEIGDLVFSCLPQSTLGQLCLVNQQTHTRCLPHLYNHVNIKIRKQWSQLEHGLKRSPFLRQVVHNYTKQLTLTCCQSSYQWLISDSLAAWCQRWMPNLMIMAFNDFAILPVERIAPFLMHPSIRTLCFRYCNLICHDQPEAYITMVPEDHYRISIYQLPALYYYDNKDIPLFNTTLHPSLITCLDLNWTDFSSTAINRLLQLIPHLTHASLGANHNRIKDANTLALEALLSSCPAIHSLKIALQQIHPAVLAKLISHYNHQLISLDIQCQDSETLTTISHDAHQLQHLVLHGQVDVDTIKGIVQHCHQLEELLLVGWHVQDIPSLLILAMARWRRPSVTFLPPLGPSKRALLTLDKRLLFDLCYTYDTPLSPR